MTSKMTNSFNKIEEAIDLSARNLDNFSLSFY